ncbi:hypothetical protein KC333_g218 [Hortaea werneckii]|nr:hypothetical protein KC333_g218 [Hortaea werneckii]
MYVPRIYFHLPTPARRRQNCKIARIVDTTQLDILRFAFTSRLSTLHDNESASCLNAPQTTLLLDGYIDTLLSLFADILDEPGVEYDSHDLAWKIANCTCCFAREVLHALVRRTLLYLDTIARSRTTWTHLAYSLLLPSLVGMHCLTTMACLLLVDWSITQERRYETPPILRVDWSSIGMPRLTGQWNSQLHEGQASGHRGSSHHCSI